MIHFVTGACGFIGSHFVRMALEADSQLTAIVYDDLTYAGDRANLGGLPRGRFTVIQGNVADSHAVMAAMPTNVDAVVNFAAETHVDRSIGSACSFVKSNVMGTQVLLDAARKRGAKRFLQISTDEVYGSAGPNEAFTEDSPLQPNNPYAASKAAADHLVRAAANTHGLDVVAARCCNNYGPRQHREKFLPTVIRAVLAGEPVPVYGDGKHFRDWIHVCDCCRGIATVLKSGESGEVYNVGARNVKANLEVVADVMQVAGKASVVRFVEDRPGHDRRYALDPTKLERLGWKPEIEWLDGLAATVRCFAGP